MSIVSPGTHLPWNVLESPLIWNATQECKGCAIFESVMTNGKTSLSSSSTFYAPLQITSFKFNDGNDRRVAFSAVGEYRVDSRHS